MMSLLWGIPYLFIKVAVDDGVSPAFVAWVRVVLGAVVLMGLAWRAGVLGGLRPKAKWLVICAITEVVIPFPLIAAGEQRVSSSVAAILIACVPLIAALVAIRFDPSEKVSGSRLVGLLIGLSGVVVLVGIDVSGSSRELVGAAVIGVAAIGYAIGPMIIKAQFGDLDPRATMGALLTVAAVILTPFAAAAPPQEMPTTEAWASMIILGLLCTAAAFVVFSVLIAEAGPGRALVITYVNPVVAVGLGVAILGESVGAGAVAGLLLILAGSWLSTDGRLPPGLMRRVGGLRRPAPAPPEITRAVRPASWTHG